MADTKKAEVFYSDSDMDALVNAFKRNMLRRGFAIGAIFFLERKSNSTGLLLSAGLPLSARLSLCDDVKAAAELAKKKFSQELQ